MPNVRTAGPVVPGPLSSDMSYGRLPVGEKESRKKTKTRMDQRGRVWHARAGNLEAAQAGGGSQRQAVENRGSPQVCGGAITRVVETSYLY